MSGRKPPSARRIADALMEECARAPVPVRAEAPVPVRAPHAGKRPYRTH
ncbi:hypothetical protein [Streptomyces cyaneofuscatus]